MPEEKVEGADPLSNAALRQFKSGLVVEYGLAIYNAQIDKATGKPQLLTQARLFRNGQLVFAGKELALDAGSQTDLKRLEASRGCPARLANGTRRIRLAAHCY